MGVWSDEDENGDDGVAGDEEEEGGVYLDVNHKRVLVEADGEVGGAVAGSILPQKRGWQASSQQMRVGSGRGGNS